MTMTTKQLIERAARYVANRNWRVIEEGTRDQLQFGWLVGAVYCGTEPGAMGREYAARKAFEDWWVGEGEYRNDGMRLTETAAERGMRLGPDATAAALNAFAASLEV